MKALGKLLKTALKLGILAAIVVGGYHGYQRYYVEAEEETLAELPTAVVEVRDITVAVSATGVLQPIRVVEIKSKASGEILEMPVELGDYVEAGDLIVQVDTRILDQELRQVEADHESAVIRLEISEKQYERAQSLFEQDLISRNDLETSEQNHTNAEAQFIRAEASLELARERLEDTTVTAPISGTVIAKTVEEGQIIASSTNNVSGGTTLIQMADLSQLEIETLVDEIDIGQVKPGLPVESTVEAFADMAFEGEVMKIEPLAQVQQSVTTFPVLSRVDNSRGLLRLGMNADVSIVIHRRPQVLAVVNEAVRTPEDALEVVALLGLDAIMSSPGDILSAAPGSAGGTVAQIEPAAAHDATAEQSSNGGVTGAESTEKHSGNGSPNSGDDGTSTNGDGVAAANGGAATATNGGSHGPRADGADGDDGADGARVARSQRGSGGGRGGGRGGGDGMAAGGRAAMRARFQSASPQERERLMQEMRRPGRQADQDPQGDIRGSDDQRREPAVVFVLGADGRMTAREILTGVRDWEVTEVLSGLQAGDEIVLLPSTSLLRSQEQTRERFARRNAIIPGGGS